MCLQLRESFRASLAVKPPAAEVSALADGTGSVIGRIGGLLGAVAAPRWLAPRRSWSDDASQATRLMSHGGLPLWKASLGLPTLPLPQRAAALRGSLLLCQPYVVTALQQVLDTLYPVSRIEVLCAAVSDASAPPRHVPGINSGQIGPELAKLRSAQGEHAEYYTLEHYDRLYGRRRAWARDGRGSKVWCKDVHGQGCRECTSCHFCRQKTADVKTRCQCGER